MLSKFSLCDESKVVIGINDDQKKTFNDLTFNDLYDKRRKLDSRYKLILKEKQNDLLSFSVFNPIKIEKIKNNKFKINKSKLNDLFIESEEKRFHKDIYNTNLFELINPYHLIVEKKYIREKYVSDRFKSKFKKEKEKLKEREYAICLDKYHDEKNDAYFQLPHKSDAYNRVKNQTIIKNAIQNHYFLVRLKNSNDKFDKNVLLSPDFTIDELKSLVKFIYRAVFVENPQNIELFYLNDLYEEVFILDDNKSLLDISKEQNYNNDLEINIHAIY